MPLKAEAVTAANLSEFDDAWAQLESWASEQYRCSETGPLLPDKEWARSLATDTHNVALLAVDRPAVVGVVIYRTSDARMLWLLCTPTRFAEVAEFLTRSIATTTGLKPWGVIGRATPRNALAGFAVPHTGKPQFPAGTVVILP